MILEDFKDANIRPFFDWTVLKVQLFTVYPKELAIFAPYL